MWVLRVYRGPQDHLELLWCCILIEKLWSWLEYWNSNKICTIVSVVVEWLDGWSLYYLSGGRYLSKRKPWLKGSTKEVYWNIWSNQRKDSAEKGRLVVRLPYRSLEFRWQILLVIIIMNSKIYVNRRWSTVFCEQLFYTHLLWLRVFWCDVHSRHTKLSYKHLANIFTYRTEGLWEG